MLPSQVPVYIKFNNKVIINLVVSKSGVAPLKKLSLPRLELMGALFAARLASEIKSTKKEHLKAFSGLIPESLYTGFRVQRKGGNN